MICLLVSATIKEISPFLEYYRDPKNQLRDDLRIDVLISGIGLTASTYSITKQLLIRKPDLIIQAGIAGCFNTNFPLGSVVAIKQDAIGDQAVIERGKLKTLFDLSLVTQYQFPFSKGWLINKSDVLKKVKVKKVKAISVNEITTSKQKINFYKNAFDPVVETMEGAALHYVCLMENIPFLQLRGISNHAGERNKKNWDLKNSISNLNKELIRLLESL
ncbi:MAG: phosphorylase family protein [Chitinophagaceae bacterium]